MAPHATSKRLSLSPDSTPYFFGLMVCLGCVVDTLWAVCETGILFATTGALLKLFDWRGSSEPTEDKRVVWTDNTVNT